MEDFQLLAQADTEGEPASAPAQNTTSQETATKTTAPGDEGETQTQRRPGGLGDMLLPLILMFVVIYFVMFRGQSKKRKHHKDMLGNLKKNDRVRTIGGIIGTVTDVRDDEVVIKIDEANNSKMHLLRSAISTVLVEGETEKK